MRYLVLLLLLTGCLTKRQQEEANIAIAKKMECQRVAGVYFEPYGFCVVSGCIVPLTDTLPLPKVP